MSYNMTFFPNMMDHYDQDVAAALMEVRTRSVLFFLWIQRVVFVLGYMYAFGWFLFFFFF